MRRAAAVLVLGAMLAALGAAWAPGRAQETTTIQPVERPLEDELVLQVRLGRFILSDGLLGYLHRGGVLLPLDELARALDFAIVVDPAAARAAGWFLAEDRRFVLDLTSGEVSVEGRAAPYDSSLVELHLDDIYVDTTLLAAWFPIDLEFDLSALAIRVTSREPLPIEQRLEREAKTARLGRGAVERPQFPRFEVPYRLIDFPFVDTTHAFDFDRSGGARASSTSLVTGDLLYMDTSLFLASDNDQLLSRARLTMGRKDPDSALLGRLRLSEFQLGDVFTPQLPLIARQREGRGVTISSFPLFRPTEFDRTTLRGELPLGWEVELYRNEILLDFQRSPTDGRYEFVDVPLLFGLNVLRLVFYGPQGQRRDETRRVFVGPGLVRRGEQFYRIAVNQQDEDTIPLGDQAFPDERRGKVRLFAEYERGITSNFAVAGSFASLPLEEGRHSYSSLGLRGALFGAFLRFDATMDTAGGAAAQGSVQTRLFGLNLFAEHGQFFDFESERVEAASDRRESRTNLRVDGTIPEWVLPRIPFSLNGTLDRRHSGRSDFNLTNRLSMFVGGVSGSNTVNYFRSGGGGTVTTSTASGSLLVNARIERLLLRGTLSYALDPVFEFNNLSLTADYTFDRDLNTRFAINQQLTGDRSTSASAAIFRVFKNVAFGANASASDDGEFAFGLTLTFSAGREPRGGTIIRHPRGLARSGAASARVFLDRNLNGSFDAGDAPLQGVRFNRRRDQETDENGVAFVTGLSSYRPTPFSIDLGSLEDPYWVPTRKGVELVPRPGKTALVDFPVVPSGEVDGTVFLRRGDGVREVSNVALQLVDAKGETVAEVRSAFDGFFLFEFVRPGRYLVRISPEQVARLRLVAPPGQEVVIGVEDDEGDIVGGLEFVLERAAAGGD